MRILVVHNYYRHPGGEDHVFDAETDLLEANGHRVIRYTAENESIPLMSAALVAVDTIWNQGACGTILKILRDHRPDIVHFHNTFPLISPAAYYACAEAGVPVVQTLHNYRLLCPAATFFRDGRVCESCLGRYAAWPGISHACYRRSRAQTAVSAAMLFTHRQMGTWQKKVKLYIALSEFARRKFIEGGLPSDRIVVKPNFVYPDPGAKDTAGAYALYVGRLSEEKGLQTLLAAWSRLGGRVPLRIAGQGPLNEYVVSTIEGGQLNAVEFLGSLSSSEVLRWMHSARFLVFPSVWFEGFPVAIIEAFASGVPVISSRMGSMKEIIEDGRTGLHFNPGDPEDLAAKVEWGWSHPQDMKAMGRNARAEYETNYTAERNYDMVMASYRQALR
jgi:glycosyltransferase involved in cell wall biosynthesis